MNVWWWLEGGPAGRGAARRGAGELAGPLACSPLLRFLQAVLCLLPQHQLQHCLPLVCSQLSTLQRTSQALWQEYELHLHTGALAEAGRLLLEDQYPA